MRPDVRGLLLADLRVILLLLRCGAIRVASRIVSALLSVSAKLRIMQGASIGENDTIKTAGRVTRFGGIYVNADYVPGNYASLAPTNEHKRRRTTCFAYPMCNFAFVILHVEIKKAVRIGPQESRHSSFLQFD